MAPTPGLSPGESQGRGSLVGCSPRDREESDTTERLHFHFSLSRIGEGNGNPLQCACLENPRDGGAWWAAVYGVTQSRTQLKRLSSSSRFNNLYIPLNLQLYIKYLVDSKLYEKYNSIKCVLKMLTHLVGKNSIIFMFF